jgi:RHS repeat-associated protein
VITAVSSFAGNTETCEGACLDAIDHVWNTTSGALDLTAVKDPSNNFTTKEFNANGLPTKVVYGDNDSNPANGGLRTMFLSYDTAFPGRVAKISRSSEFPGDSCTPNVPGTCVETVSTFTADGLLDTVVQNGKTLNSSNSTVSFSYTTDYDYDPQGRLTQIDGPLSGNDDITLLEYWSSADPLKDGFLQNLKRKKDASTFLVQSSLGFDFWGNATSISDADGTISCQTFDSARNYLTQRREQMNGQTDCTANAADLVTSYARDSALRLTQLTRPDGSCLHHEYDSRGRLSKVKRRDDCNPASTGDTQELTYSDEGLLIKTELKDSSGTVKKRQELTYFDSRRLEKLINPVNTAKWTGLTWDPRGLVDTIAAIDAGSDLSKTQWTYNAEGRIATEKRLIGGGVFDTWSVLFGWLGNQTRVTDGTSKQIDSSRDDLNRVVSISGNDFAYNAGQSRILQIYDAASRLVTVKEAFGLSDVREHSFSFDHLSRPLNDDYFGHCIHGTTGAQINVPDIVRIYDTLSGGPACPGGTSCANLTGRLAYEKVRFNCTTAAGPDGDYTLEQETWYGYDAAGRKTHEYISDDNGRTAAHVFAWTKNGALSQSTLPSGAVLGATFGSGGSNSDTDRTTALWRTNTGTPIIDNVLYEPFGPVSQYNQQNSPGTGQLRTRIARNLAYRQTLNVVEKTDGTNVLSSVTITEDNKGRTTQRDYFPSDPTIAGRFDSFYTFDRQDRVVCEATTSGACPTSGATLKNNHSELPPFTAGGDWKFFHRPIPGSTGTRHPLTLYTTSTGVGTHWLYTVNQDNGTPTLGLTYHGRDSFNARTYDDNTSTMTNDGRNYTKDARHNVINVLGLYKPGATWNYYNVASSFDAKNRRVFKSFYNQTTAKTATWFFYYDALDRLSEIRYTPDTSAASTYSLFQLVWLGDKLVLYWQTDYPSVTTSKRYVSTDEMNRPVDMMSWPAAGAASRVWTINPDAWGNDTVLVGSSVFQPILFAGQYKDDETIAWHNDGTTRHRPGVVLNGFRAYDPWLGLYLQVDPLVDSTWSPYVYANTDPVGKQDPSGLAFRLSSSFGNDFWTTGQVGCWSSNSTLEVSSCLAGFLDPWGLGFIDPSLSPEIGEGPQSCSIKPAPDCIDDSAACEQCVDDCNRAFNVSACECIFSGFGSPLICEIIANSSRDFCLLDCLLNSACDNTSHYDDPLTSDCGGLIVTRPHKSKR